MLFSLLKGLEICFIYLLNCGKLYNKQVRLQQVFFFIEDRHQDHSI